MTSEICGKREAKAKATQRAIVEAAEKLFMDKGFAATAISEVAAEAGITKSLIHHHFGSKEALWDAVEDKHLEFVNCYLERMLNDCGNCIGADFYTAAVKHFFKFAEENQGLLKMQTWICAEQRGKRTKTTSKLLEIITNMQKEQEEGVLRKDISARMIMIMFWSLVEQWFIARTVYGNRLGTDFNSREAEDEYIEAITKLFTSGLFAPGHDTK